MTNKELSNFSYFRLLDTEVSQNFSVGSVTYMHSFPGLLTGQKCKPFPIVHAREARARTPYSSAPVQST